MDREGRKGFVEDMQEEVEGKDMELENKNLIKTLQNETFDERPCKRGSRLGYGEGEALCFAPSPASSCFGSCLF